MSQAETTDLLILLVSSITVTLKLPNNTSLACKPASRLASRIQRQEFTAKPAPIHHGSIKIGHVGIVSFELASVLIPFQLICCDIC